MKRAQFKSAEELSPIDLEHGEGRSGDDEDRHWMGAALSDAEAAGRRREVPIGAVIVIVQRIFTTLTTSFMDRFRVHSGT